VSQNNQSNPDPLTLVSIVAAIIYASGANAEASQSLTPATAVVQARKVIAAAQQSLNLNPDLGNAS
jgi:hypothetical protein